VSAVCAYVGRRQCGDVYLICAFVQITLATCLYDRGLIVTRVPMEPLSDDDDDDSCDAMSQSSVDSASETWSPSSIAELHLSDQHRSCMTLLDCTAFIRSLGLLQCKIIFRTPKTLKNMGHVSGHFNKYICYVKKSKQEIWANAHETCSQVILVCLHQLHHNSLFCN